MPSDTKIVGTPEGREGVWLLTPDAAIEFVESLPQEEIHNFIGHEAVFCGADWCKADVVEHLLMDGLKIALVFPPNVTMRHQLVAINNSRRWSFDVGEIDESRMVSAEPAAK